jgi:hypothetical protein
LSAGTPDSAANPRLDHHTGVRPKQPPRSPSANTLGFVLYAPVFDATIGVPNISRFIFLDPLASEFFHDWDNIAKSHYLTVRLPRLRVLAAPSGHQRS